MQANTTEDSVDAISDMNYAPECEFDYGSADYNIVASIASTTLQTEPKNLTLQIGNTEVTKKASQLTIQVYVVS